MRRRLLLFSLGFCLVILSGEVLLQVVDPFDYGLIEDKEQFAEVLLDPATGQLRAGVTARYLGKPTRVSAQGLRNPIVKLPKPEGVCRILCLGGSVVFGWGVGEGEEYPRLLEAQLRAAGWPAGRRVEVVNCGVPGRLGVESLRFLAERGPDLQPDLVCLLLVAPDLGGRFDLGMQSDRQFLSEDLRQVRLLRALENRLVYGGLGNRVGGSLSVEAEVADAAMPVLGQALQDFAQTCRAMGAQPMLIDTLGRQDVAPMAAAAEIWYLDGYLPVELRRSWEVAPTDPHMGPAGHRHFAAMIVANLLPRQLK